jgi:hypothetical protein
MLNIQLDDADSHRVVMILHGHIMEDLAAVLVRECLALRRSGLGVVLVLSGFAFVGRSGARALGRLARAGVGIVGSSPGLADALEREGVNVDQAIGDSNDGNVPGREGGATDPSA